MKSHSVSGQEHLGYVSCPVFMKRATLSDGSKMEDFQCMKESAVPHGNEYVVISTTHHIQSIIIHPFPMLMPGVMEK